MKLLHLNMIAESKKIHTKHLFEHIMTLIITEQKQIYFIQISNSLFFIYTIYCTTFQ